MFVAKFFDRRKRTPEKQVETEVKTEVEYDIDNMTKDEITKELVKKGITDFNKRDLKEELFAKLVE